MEDEQIYILLCIILFLIIWYCYQPKKDIFNHSLMVHLENDKFSQKRIQEVKDIYNDYNLPMHLMKATHWKHDEEELKTYPLDKDKITGKNVDYRPGAYGLAGSFYKCLKQAYDEDWPHLLFLEDDAVPILPKDQFYDRFNEVLSTLPDNGNGIYMLGLTIWCNTDPNDDIGWKQYKDFNTPVHGAHAVYFGKESIHRVMNYFKNNNLTLAIDNFINSLPGVWYWYGDLSENGMFRGLYKQLGLDCHNVRTLEGPINSS
jgi:GR25 family glycosyltransferase involved in LPS biosynthesis